MAATKFPAPGATDCHIHVAGPKRRVPLPSEARYTPSDANVGALAAMAGRGPGIACGMAVSPRWLDDDALIHRVLVDNPARLYGFG